MYCQEPDTNVWVTEFKNAEKLFFAIWKDKEDTKTGKRQIMQMGVTALAKETKAVAQEWVLAVAKMYASKEMTKQQIEENKKAWLAKLGNNAKLTSDPWQSTAMKRKPAAAAAATASKSQKVSWHDQIPINVAAESDRVR